MEYKDLSCTDGTSIILDSQTVFSPVQRGEKILLGDPFETFGIVVWLDQVQPKSKFNSKRNFGFTRVFVFQIWEFAFERGETAFCREIQNERDNLPKKGRSSFRRRVIATSKRS
jgi:hypothetical protein